MRWRLAVAVFVLALGLWTVASTARVSTDRPAPVAIQHRAASGRVVLVFIDSLSREIATDAARMPTLARLADEGVSFEVQPCRDQLTYLCVRAALTGHDDSSLLSIADNFRPEHEGPPETLLSAVAARHERAVVIGTRDFHPYRHALFAERVLPKKDETPARVLAEFHGVASTDPRLVIVSLGSGDMAAHAYGAQSAQYDEAFRRLDGVVDTLSGALSGSDTLVVFGDHGHDAQGRHLPGVPSLTWALYRGPAFRAGARLQMGITDHRALLGLVLGVPTEPLYRGPPLASVLEPAWVTASLGGTVPPLEAPRERIKSHSAMTWPGVAALAGAGLLFLWIALPGSAGRRLPCCVAASAVAMAASCGAGFDQVRSLVHDHGDAPERGLSLLAPLAVGCAVATLAQRRHRPGPLAPSSWWQGAAASIVLVTFLLLLPTAYYYGSRRAIVPACLLAILAMVIDHRRRAAPAARALPPLLLAFTAATLASLYQVRQLGAETAGAATWALDSAAFGGAAWLTLVVAKAVLAGVVFGPGASRRPVDTAVALSLLLACLAAELTSLRLPRFTQLLFLGVHMVGATGAPRRAPRTALSSALLLLVHLYDGNVHHLAPVQAILAATATALAAWRRMELSPLAARLSAGLTVAVAMYVMFWPTVGFHVAGIDYAFMFQWVAPEDYERSWRLIAASVILKLALPLILILSLAEDALRHPVTARIVLLTLAAKATLLSILIATYSVGHPMSSQQALTMLAELILVLFGVSVCAVALPVTLGVTATGPLRRPENVPSRARTSPGRVPAATCAPSLEPSARA